MNRTKLAQIGAIIYYELLMQRRGRALVGLMAGLLAMLLLSALLLIDTVEKQKPLDGITGGVMGLGFTCIYLLLVLLCPPFVADSLPKDRQLGVAELLDSTTITPGVYLVGKLLGVWLAIVIGLALVLPLSGLGFWLILGPYNVVKVLIGLAWLILPLTFINPVLGTLLAAGQPTRRRAMFVGVVIALATMFLLIFSLDRSSFWEPTNNGTSFGELASISRPVIFRQLTFNFLPTSSSSSLFEAVNFYDAIGLTTLTGIVQVALAGLGMWIWRSKHEVKY